MNVNANKQTGSAIVAAVFIVALVATIAGAMAMMSRQLTHLALGNKNVTTTKQLFSAALLDVTAHLEDSNNSTNEEQTIVSNIKNVKIVSKVIAAPSLLNINAYYHLKSSDTPQVKHNLTLFLQQTQISPHPEQLAQAIIAALNDHITPTGEKINLYQWPGKPFTVLSELRTIPGVNANIYNKMLPWFSVLPPTTKITPNAKHWPILIALGYSNQQIPKITSCLSSSINMTSSRKCIDDQQPTTNLTSQLTNNTRNPYYRITSTITNSLEQQTTLIHQYTNQHPHWQIIWQQHNYL